MHSPRIAQGSPIAQRVSHLQLIGRRPGLHVGMCAADSRFALAGLELGLLREPLRIFELLQSHGRQHALPCPSQQTHRRGKHTSAETHALQLVASGIKLSFDVAFLHHLLHLSSAPISLASIILHLSDLRAEIGHQRSVRFLHFHLALQSCSSQECGGSNSKLLKQPPRPNTSNAAMGGLAARSSTIPAMIFPQLAWPHPP